ncbi:NAD(P)-binding oxidoreductase [Ornithinibacillus xuwenensis]|uniref:NAD(P)-binding oxidoreductase n=1 Tax=Ornithinibacillus xuwenensis TaxID=3144668 RepID=A0ABU9XF15_9BACI
MRVLVLGASGATGKQVVRQLMKRKVNTRILIRQSAVLPKDIQEDSLVEIVKGNINELKDAEMISLVRDCTVIISCLGHNPTIKGMFGKPRCLVWDAVKSIGKAVREIGGDRVKIILMSTTGYTNTMAGEKNPMLERIILSLLLLLPPHRDNVKSANYFVNEIGKKDENMEWIAVRPDKLINSDEESSYEVYDSPVRSPIFNAGKTSRINVGHFMAELATDDAMWLKWQFKTPVIYNK